MWQMQKVHGEQKGEDRAADSNLFETMKLHIS